jgi:hypothetical protein
VKVEVAGVIIGLGLFAVVLGALAGNPIAVLAGVLVVGLGAWLGLS